LKPFIWTLNCKYKKHTFLSQNYRTDLTGDELVGLFGSFQGLEKLEKLDFEFNALFFLFGLIIINKDV